MAASLLSSYPDKLAVRRSFSRASSSYDAVAGLQRQTAEELIDRLAQLNLNAARIVDVGSGTGYPSRALLRRFPNSHLVLLDCAEGMLRVARGSDSLGNSASFLCGDAECMPISGGAADMVFSSLALQWCPNIELALREFDRLLVPGGAVAFSLFTGRTLHELRAAWAAVDRSSHVSDFVHSQSLRAWMKKDAFERVFFEVKEIVLEYDSVFSLMRELKSLGASNATYNRVRHLTGKGALARMVSAYEQAMGEGRIKATFEIAQCIAVKR